MQTEVPTLPVVHFNAHKNLNRKQNSNLGRPSVEAKVSSASSPHKIVACLSSKKKNLHPLLGQPYQSNVRHYPPSEQSKHKNSIEQRVLSAKMLRIKELQNQLADAHYRLNEIANENKLLKALQKRQDSALKRYEGTNAELPRIINSHHEELRVLQVKYNEGIKKSTYAYYFLTLHRKLSLETKSLKQQLHIETSKRKETQKHLDGATEKLRTLENLLDNRERRLYYNGQLLFPDRIRRFGTQSLTNLRDISSSNPLKLLNKGKKWQTDVHNNSLPVLHTHELNDKNIRTNEPINLNQTLDCVKTETMTNLEQVRKYRLQKSPHKKILLDDTEEKPKVSEFTMNENSEISVDLENSEQLQKYHGDIQKYEISADKFRQIYKNQKYQNCNELLKKELTYSSEGSESENENFKDTSATNNSKQLYARLISSADDTSDSKELTFSDCKYKNKLRVLVRERKNSYESDSEIESEVKKGTVKHYLTRNYQDNTLKLMSPMCNHTDYNSNQKVEKSTSSKHTLNGSQKLYQNLIDEMHVQVKNVENENVCALYDAQDSQTDYASPEDLKKYIFEQAISEKQEHNNVNVTKNELVNESFLETYSTGEHNVSFKTFNEEESLDIKSEKVSHTNETLFNDSQKKSTQDLLNPSINLNKEIADKTDIAEIELISKNIFVETYDLETRNKLNKHELKKELRNIDMVHDVQALYNEPVHDRFTDVNTTNEISIKTKITNYNKEKLLASMKAIDNNENIEYLNQDYEKHNVTSQKQIAGSVFHDIPTHMKKKQDIIKDIFDTDVIKNESTGSCNKLH
ncbi:Lebercilin [Habropoda laboriosa]|uniref:Lebercilin n=1 Tax=Habropoda laboriosa TaxID=597456 RepID=A0A0L7RI53_9HYME|nr:Lebercilin [Habropoda laboriosa]